MYQLIPVPFLGGVNLQDDVRSLKQGQVAYAKNLFPAISGKLSKRPGAQKAELSTAQITGGADFRPPVKLIFPSFGTGFLAVLNASNKTADSAQLLTSVGQDTYDLDCTLSQRPSYVEFNDKGYVFAGRTAGAPGFVLTKNPADADGYTISSFAFAGSGNESIRPEGACLYRSRFVYWFDNYLLFSDRFQPDVVGDNATAANGRAVLIGSADGDRIIACVDIMLTSIGSPAQSALLVLKEKSMYLITGEPNQTTDTDQMFLDLVINRSSIDAGCISPDTVARTPYGVVWCGPDDVWIFSGGSVPQRLGYNIKPALKDSNPADRIWCYGAYADDVYKLGVKPATGRTLQLDAGDPDFASYNGQTMNDIVCTEEYWLDLRNGPPPAPEAAQWWGPQVFNIFETMGSDDEIETVTGNRGYFVDTRSNPLFSSHIGLGFSLTDSEVHLYTFEPGVKRDGLPSSISPAEMTGNEVYTELRLPELFNTTSEVADPSVDKVVLGAEVSLYLNTPAAFNTWLIGNSGGVIKTMDVNPDQIGFVLDIDELDNAALTSEVQALKFAPDEGERIVARSYQLKMTDTGGLSLPEGLNTFVFTYNGGQYTVSLGAGVSTEPSFLSIALAILMDAAVGGGVFTGGYDTEAAPDNAKHRISAASGIWRPNPDSDAGTKFLLALMGFPTTDADFVSQATHLATHQTYPLLAAELDILSVAIRIRPLNRRPA